MKRSTQGAAARERDHRLRDRFGEVLWNVASEPGCRSVYHEDCEGGSKYSRFIPVNG